MRAQLNRLILVIGLAIALPAIIVTGRVRRGAGRRLSVRAIKVIGGLCGISFEVRGADRLDRRTSYVLVPNHTSPVDIAAMLIARPDSQFVAAAGLFRIPLLGSAMRALGTVPITRGDRGGAHRQIDKLSRPHNDRELVMFAEGGIAPTDEVLPFKTGPFVVAINSGDAIVPVAITGAATVLPRRSALKARPGNIRIDLLEPVLTDGLVLEDRRRLADRVRSVVVDTLGSARPTLAA